MRYFITFSYDGTKYHGWQIQPNGISVQEVLQKALSTLLRQDIEVVGAGRTDAGVHAKMMVAHFTLGQQVNEIASQQVNKTTGQQDGKTTAQKLNKTTNQQVNQSAFQQEDSIDCEQLVYKLNKILPHDIGVQKVEVVSDDMHARFSATSRTYHYFVHLKKNPFLRAYSWQVYGDLDFCKMNEASKILLGTHDFTSFSKTNTDTKTNLCTITEAFWEELEPGVWRFTISANRFLRNMVRAIVGTLVEVGRGKLTVEGLQRVIEEKDRCSAGESVPGNALFLVDVRYGEVVGK